MTTFVGHVGRIEELIERMSPLVADHQYLVGKPVRAIDYATGAELYRGKVTKLIQGVGRQSTAPERVRGLCGYCGIYAEIEISKFRHHLCRVEFVERVGERLPAPWVNEMGADG